MEHLHRVRLTIMICHALWYTCLRSFIRSLILINDWLIVWLIDSSVLVLNTLAVHFRIVGCSASTRPRQFTAVTGSITSPNYNQLYHNNANCEWKISAFQNGVSLRFTVLICFCSVSLWWHFSATHRVLCRCEVPCISSIAVSSNNFEMLC